MSILDEVVTPSPRSKNRTTKRVDGPELVRTIVALESLYGKSRGLPRFEPMEELVCCIMSQNTADILSFPAFIRLRAAFPDWAEMAQAGAEGIRFHIQEAGLANQKSKSIAGCLDTIFTRTGGYSLELLRTMPDDEAMQWLMSLPGVGPKTASLVLGFCFGRATIPVDTHVHRVATRLGWLPAKCSPVKAHAVVSGWVPPEWAYRFHAALIQHGRHLCAARNPRCSDCPLFTECPGRQQ